MKYAVINGVRTEANKGLRGDCIGCGASMLAKCGDKNVNHWAHKSRRVCDTWWENETAWHRDWKGAFPEQWQEVVHKDDSGEIHIADVKTDEGWVFEFQHSAINRDEQRSRSDYYNKLAWVVDGTRRKRDKTQFMDHLKHAGVKEKSGKVHAVSLYGPCRLVSDWKGLQALVLFDFAGSGDTDFESVLWLMLPCGIENEIFLMPLSRQGFINKGLDLGMNAFDKEVVLPVVRDVNLRVEKDQKRREYRDRQHKIEAAARMKSLGF